MNDHEQRTPTENTYKLRVLKEIDDISRIYKKVIYEIQIAELQGQINSEMLEYLFMYSSGIISLYRSLKPKIPVAKKRDPEIEELEIIDEYIIIMNNIRVSNVREASMIFSLLNRWEDLLRRICENLGYTSDNPE